MSLQGSWVRGRSSEIVHEQLQEILIDSKSNSYPDTYHEMERCLQVERREDCTFLEDTVCERTVTDRMPLPTSDELSAASSEDTYVMNNITCRMFTKDGGMPCSCERDDTSPIDHIPDVAISYKATNGHLYRNYDTEGALSRARELLNSATNLRRIIQNGLCNSFCSIDGCGDWENSGDPYNQDSDPTHLSCLSEKRINES